MKQIVFTPKRVILGLIYALAPALGAFAIVGFAARPPKGSFQWDAAAISGTGVATAVLAAFTGALALATSDDVAQTSELVAIERKRFEKEDEPYVTPGPLRVHDGDVHSSITNAGRGAATQIHWEAYFAPQDGSAELAPANLDVARGPGALLGGTSMDIDFPAWMPLGSEGRYSTRGIYADREGRGPHYFGLEPVGGWDAWLAARASDPWWRDILRLWKLAP